MLDYPDILDFLQTITVKNNVCIEQQVTPSTVFVVVELIWRNNMIPLPSLKKKDAPFGNVRILTVTCWDFFLSIPIKEWGLHCSC